MQPPDRWCKPCGPTRRKPSAGCAGHWGSRASHQCFRADLDHIESHTGVVGGLGPATPPGFGHDPGSGVRRFNLTGIRLSFATRRHRMLSRVNQNQRCRDQGLTPVNALAKSMSRLRCTDVPLAWTFVATVLAGAVLSIAAGGNAAPDNTLVKRFSNGTTHNSVGIVDAAEGP